MSKNGLLALLLTVCLTACPLMAAPPNRPLPLTHSQFSALEQLEEEPTHRAVREVHATYLSEHELQMEKTKTADDISTAATFLGYIGAVAAILILGVF